MARSLVVAPEPFFTPRGTPFSVYYRTLVMAELGMHIDLLTYGTGDDIDIPGVRTIRIPRFRILEPIPVGPSFAKAVLDIFVTLWMFALLVRNRYAFVHAHEEAVFIARVLKPLFGFSLIYDMHSSLPQQLRNFAFTQSRWLTAIFDRLERSAIRHADAVITISPHLAAHAQSLLPPGHHHELIENSIHTPVQLRKQQKQNAPLEIPADRKLILYAGTFEPYQGLGLLLAAFSDLHRQQRDTQLVLIGGTPQQVSDVRRKAHDLALDGRVHVFGQVSQETVREATAQAAVVVSPRTTGSNTPLKVYEILAGKTPLVATRISAHTQVLTDTECFLVDPLPAAMAAGMAQAIDDTPLAQAKVTAAQHLYGNRYSRQVYEAKLKRVINFVAPGTV